jgi:hypothetical protein
MEIVNEYDKLCQKIWELRNTFYKQYHVKSNIVNVGYDELYVLKNGNQFLVENGTTIESKDFTIFGMKLNHSIQDNYLSVGFVIE